jgi:O-antigen/teichoic acid export membrane protein
MVLALNAVLSGLGRMDLANYIQSAGRVVIVVVAGALLYSGRGIESLLIAYSASYVLIHIASLIYIRRMAPIRILRTDNLDIHCAKSLLRFGGAMFSSSIMNMLFDPFNKLMLSRYAGVSSIAVYDIVYRGSGQIRALIETGFRALMPEISRIGANMTTQARNRISQLNHHATKLLFLFGIPLYAGLIMFITPFLKLWLKEKFVDELPVAFMIMLVGTFISLFGVPAYYTLLGTGMVRYTLIAQFIQSIVSAMIILAIIFIFRCQLSIEAVFLAVSFATMVRIIYLRLQNYQKVLKVRL